MRAFNVLSPGVLTLIQDLGRTGVGHIGLSSGGPADLHAFCWANRLVGNSTQSAALEITMGGLVLEAINDVVVAIAGADMQATLDGHAIGNWRSFCVAKGQKLKFGFARKGLRSYLAIHSGLKVHEQFGSGATVVRNQMGGLPDNPGCALEKMSLLEVHKESSAKLEPVWTARRFIAEYPDVIEVPLIEGAQREQFTDQQMAKLYQSEFVVSDKLDRMGIRLEGEAIIPPIAGIISEGIAPGAVQIPPNGQPIILINDRQTLGGYPKIGCVSKMGLMAIGQCKPGTKVRFIPSELSDELERFKSFAKFFGLYSR